jgi:hypothetical protein
VGGLREGVDTGRRRGGMRGQQWRRKPDSKSG